VRRTWFILAAAIVGCSRAPDLTQPPSSNTRADRASNSARYSIIAIPLASGDGINAHGDVAGLVATSTGNFHAALWRHGAAKDLGTLGGPNSEVQWPGINNHGTVVGFSEAAAISPLGEHWSCSAFFPSITGHICRGFVWKDDHMVAMPTLGGDNSIATEINDRGRVVGWAETAVHDPTCHAPQVLQFRAVVWHPASGRMHELRPLPGDSASAATAINDWDQVVGISGACDTAVGGISARRAVMWDHGRVIDIGGLGGTAWNTAMDINNNGTVVGFADLAGDQNGANINFHAFLWTRERGIIDLATLPNDALSEAVGINDRDQVVGISIGATARAFLWERGKMQNLQDLLPAGYPNTLIVAQDINDDGVITGQMVDKSTGNLVGFVATPNRK
jgi:probable HAF family extracellular repeat protein